MSDQSGNPQIRELKTDEEIMSCYSVMSELRPHVAEADFLPQVKRQMAAGFQLAGVEDHGKIVAVVGFRIQEFLAKGKHIYIDDLVTLETVRSLGYGHLLLDWAADYASAQGCQNMYLDSGVQRKDAHRFYFRERMHLMAYHFAKKIG